MTKDELRNNYLNKRNNLDYQTKQILDKKIFDNLLNSSVYKTAKNIMTFISFQSEVDTHSIIKSSLDNNKNIYVPITDYKNRKLLVSQLTNFHDLEIGHYNILTPKKSKINLIDPKKLDLILVPGLVFDKFGYRIGFGGGYYDKFLAQFKKTDSNTISLGVCYNFQVINKVIKEEYDIPVDFILTEEGFIDLTE